MTTQQAQNGKAARTPMVTTNTGRILRVNPEDIAAAPVTPAAIADPSRREDVLFRVRREAGHELSVWWMIGAFVGTSALIIALLSGVPGAA